MDDLEDISDKFLETYKLSKLNNEETENLNRTITNEKIESVTKTLSTEKSPVRYYFTGEFSQTFNKELTPVPLKLSQKN